MCYTNKLALPCLALPCLALPCLAFCRPFMTWFVTSPTCDRHSHSVDGSLHIVLREALSKYSPKRSKDAASRSLSGNYGYIRNLRRSLSRELALRRTLGERYTNATSVTKADECLVAHYERTRVPGAELRSSW